MRRRGQVVNKCTNEMLLSGREEKRYIGFVSSSGKVGGGNRTSTNRRGFIA